MIEPFQTEAEFLAELESTPRAPDRLDAWWLGQSSFLVQSGPHRVLLDPYLSDSLTAKYAGTKTPHVRISRQVVGPQHLREIDVVSSSHGHTDHLDAATLNPLFAANPQAALIYPLAIETLVHQRVTTRPAQFVGLNDRVTADANGVQFTALAVPHPRYETDERGQQKYLSYIVTIGAFTVFHCGDCLRDERFDVYWPGTHVDLAMLPINGKLDNLNGTDAAQLAKLIHARLVVPCHYHMFEFNSAEPDEQFVPECRRINQPCRVLKMAEKLTMHQGSET